MNEIKGLCEQVKRDIMVFSANMAPHLGRQDIQLTINDSYANIDDLFTMLCQMSELFELLCFMKNNDAEVAKSASSSPAVNNTDIYAILRQLDKCSYKIYHYVKHNASKYTHPALLLLRKIVETDKPVALIQDLIPESYQLFEKVNLGMLRMKDTPLDEVPEGGRIVSFSVPNTRKMLYSCDPLVNPLFIKENYKYARSAGLCDDIVRRFDNNKDYSAIKGGDEEEDLDDILIDEIMAKVQDVGPATGEYVGFQRIIDAPGVIQYEPFADRLTGGSIVEEGHRANYYQMLGKKDGKPIYRELTDFDKRDSARNYRHIGATMFVNNVENKRINMLKTNHKEWKKNLVTRELLGEIKMKYRDRRIGSAIFDTMEPRIKTDEEMLRLIACCMDFDSNANVIKSNPAYLDNVRNFSKLALI